MNELRNRIIRHRLVLIDLALILTAVLMFFLTDMIVFLFHIIFVVLAIGAFFWKFRTFALRASFWVILTTAMVLRAVLTGQTQSDELIEIPLLSIILMTVFFISSRRAQAQIQLENEHVALNQASGDRHEALIKLEKQVKQLTVLHEVALVSTQVETIDRLIERVTEIIGKNLFPDNFGILLMDEQKGVLHPHPSYRFVSAKDLIPTDIPIGQGITGQVAKMGQPIRIGNIEGIQNYLEVDQGTASELCVPIKLKDRVLGVINTESTRTDAFSIDDELLLGTLAGQLATAIEQLRAATAERQWLNQLAHSNELIYALAHITTHIEKALSQEQIIQTLGIELNKIGLTCIMAVYDADRRLFTINYTSIESKDLELIENGLGFPLLQYTFSRDKLNSVLKTGDILPSAAASDPLYEIQMLFNRPHREGISKILEGIGVTPNIELLRLPLVFEESLLGILWVWGKGITKADLPVMSIFAKQIGISLE